MEHERMGFREAVAELAARAGLELPKEAREDAPAPSADLLGIVKEAAQFYRRQLREHPQAGQAVEYLKGRGITSEIAASFGLGYAPEGWDNLLRALGQDAASRETLFRAGLVIKKENGGYYDRFRHRIMFPIHDHRGRIVGFGGRVLVKEEPKYLNSPETPLFHKGRELYGLYRARDAIRQAGKVLVVEGYMDVVALAQFGVDFAVATLGTATTRDHLERLFRHAPEVVYCFDGDRAGREAAWRALEVTLEVLHDGRQASFLFLPEGEDPDSLVRREGREAFLTRLAAAKPLPDFFFESLAGRVDLSRLDGRARLVELARAYLSNLRHGVLRQMMLERLGELSRYDPEKLSIFLGSIEESRAGTRDPRAGAGRKDPPSTVRLAIAMLLQHPGLAAGVPDAGSFGDLEQPGSALLLQLLELLKTSPNLNTAAIIDNFSDSEHKHHIVKLAVWHHPALEQPSVADLFDLLEKLRRDAIKSRVDKLLFKQPLQGLDAQEVAELRRLLEEKYKMERLSGNH
jgi:DNA primase